MVETAKYQVVRRIGKIEIRRYPDLILASTTASNDNSAFMIIANFIFGNNKSKSKIAMTSPVITSEKIPMTTPVITSRKNYKMSFVMPSNYTLKKLPKPNSNKVKIETQKSRKIAVLRFTGFTYESKLKKLEKIFIKSLAENKIKTKGDIFLMRYNSPWTLPFLRRNEIAVEIK